MSLSTARHLAASFVLVGLTASSGEVFFDNGNTDWKIFLSPKAAPTERYAAGHELRHHALHYQR